MRCRPKYCLQCQEPDEDGHREVVGMPAGAVVGSETATWDGAEETDDEGGEGPVGCGGRRNRR
jgi:hypothetical protein